MSSAALVPRTELLDRLQAVSLGTVVQIVAPAGYGKSFLLDSWSASSRLRPVLVTLSDATEPPSALAARIVGALTSQVGVAPTDSGSPLSQILGLMESSPVLLIIDDIHVIEDSETRELLASLARYLPRNCVLALAGRSGLGSALAKPAALGLVAHLTAEDLQLTDRELMWLRRAQGAAMEMQPNPERWPHVARLLVANSTSRAADEPTSSEVDAYMTDVLAPYSDGTLDFLALAARMPRIPLFVIKDIFDEERLARVREELTRLSLPVTTEALFENYIDVHPRLRSFLLRQPAPNRLAESKWLIAQRLDEVSAFNTAFQVLASDPPVPDRASWYALNRAVVQLMLGSLDVLLPWAERLIDLDLENERLSLIIHFLADLGAGHYESAARQLDAYHESASQLGEVTSEGIELGPLMAELLGGVPLGQVSQTARTANSPWAMLAQLMWAVRYTFAGEFSLARGALTALTPYGSGMPALALSTLAFSAYVDAQIGDLEEAVRQSNEAARIAHLIGLKSHACLDLAEASTLTVLITRDEPIKARRLTRRLRDRLARGIDGPPAVVLAVSLAVAQAARSLRDDKLVRDLRPLIESLSEMTPGSPDLNRRSADGARRNSPGMLIEVPHSGRVSL